MRKVKTIKTELGKVHIDPECLRIRNNVVQYCDQCRYFNTAKKVCECPV